MTLHEEYQARLAKRSDMAAHLPRLAAFARECQHVTEFGVRHGESTIALLAGLSERQAPGQLVSYDIRPCIVQIPELPEHVNWAFLQRDTGALNEIAPTDLLFVDSLHTSAHVTAELRQAQHVRRWIVLHDTVTFATKGDAKQLGIGHAIYCFLAEHATEWRVKSHTAESHGLLVLERIGQ